jgi:hypothetical protein
MYHKYIIIAVLFLMGAYFVLNYSSADFKEALTMPKNTNSSKNCPNVLVQKGSKIYLYNSSKQIVPGVNPISFNNLEEYVQFTEWQRSVGFLCPVLYLQHTENAQGEIVYKIRPGPTDLQGGLPPVTNPNALPPPRKHITKLLDASRDDKPFNVNSYPGYDASNMDQGEFTPDMMLDYIQQSTGLSPNPMDTNWGGADFTQSLINAGYYAENNVALSVGK